MKKILLSLLIIAGAISVIIGGTVSFLGDSESSIGNTFSFGVIDISVNGELLWTQNFNWEHAEPGQHKEIQLVITNEGTNPVKLWKAIKNVVTEENGIVEPEQVWYDEQNAGQPKNNIDSAIVYEMLVDGEPLISQSENITLDQIKGNYMNLLHGSSTGDVLNPGESITVVQKYYLQSDTPNWAQSDQMTFDLEIEARQVDAPTPDPQWDFSNNPGSTCTDADSDNYYLESSGCGAKPDFLGHNDCNDTDLNINPGAAEICTDSIDNDCDALIDCADSDCDTDPACVVAPSVPGPGDLVINEIMQNPDVVSDNNGEWFEIYNNSDHEVELAGCTFTDLGTNSFTIVGSNTLPADEYFVLGTNADLATNGGVNIDYEYSGFNLGNHGDEIILTCDGTEIDRVEYDGGPNFPHPEGASMILNSPNSDNNLGSNWCESTSSFGDGDLGTPGSQNDLCNVVQSTIFLGNLGTSPQYGYDYDYDNAQVGFVYNTPTHNQLTGTLTATGLKPHFTYQVKFEGKPTCLYPTTGNDAANEQLGYLGRWWNNDTNQNVDDTYYESHPTECISGYLVWDYITTDVNGNVTKDLATANSYHVLWCSGGVCDTTGNNHLTAGLDPAYPSLPLCSANDVSGQIERFTCHGLTLPVGDYDLKMVLTEESFHQSGFGGQWPAVLGEDINFSIE